MNGVVKKVRHCKLCALLSNSVYTLVIFFHDSHDTLVWAKTLFRLYSQVTSCFIDKPSTFAVWRWRLNYSDLINEHLLVLV